MEIRKLQKEQVVQQHEADGMEATNQRMYIDAVIARRTGAISWGQCFCIDTCFRLSFQETVLQHTGNRASSLASPPLELIRSLAHLLYWRHLFTSIMSRSNDVLQASHLTASSLCLSKAVIMLRLPHFQSCAGTASLAATQQPAFELESSLTARTGLLGATGTGTGTLMQHMRDGHKRLMAERDALVEELSTLQRSLRATRCRAWPH